MSRYSLKRLTLVSMQSPVQTKLQTFDVFSKANRGEWKFSGCIEARDQRDAKYVFMQANQIVNPNNVAVYLKR